MNLGLANGGAISKVLTHFSVPKRQNEVVASQPSACDWLTISKSKKRGSFSSTLSSCASTSSGSRSLPAKQLGKLEKTLEDHKHFSKEQVRVEEVEDGAALDNIPIVHYDKKGEKGLSLSNNISFSFVLF